MPLPRLAYGYRFVHTAWIRTSILVVLLVAPFLSIRASVTANPSSLAFGSVQVGSKVTLPLVLTNSGGATITISRGRMTGLGFSVAGAKLPLTLGPGQSYTLTFAFSPKSSGDSSGSASAYGSLGLLVTVPLSGTGGSAGQLTVSPAVMNFGNVTIGSGASQNGTLSAGGSSVTVASASSSSSQFVLTGMSLPVTLSAGQNASYTVTFTPQSSGTASATLSFVSNAGNSPTVESLTGIGVLPTPHSVNLSWDASTSQVVGYNVYRSGNPSGPFSRVNPTLDPLTTYADGTVVSGQTYYYATTSVDSSGEESSYSNQATAVIP